MKIKQENQLKEAKIEREANYIEKIKKSIGRQTYIIEESREFIQKKHEKESELKQLSYDASGRQT